LSLVLITLLQEKTLLAQQQTGKNPPTPAPKIARHQTWKGELRGTICETAHDSVLRSATVAIYRIKDSTLLAYRLTDTKGGFSFKDLPAGTPLKLVASFIGYADNQQMLTLQEKDTVVDLGKIPLKARSNTLDEVVVSAAPPPVRINGDTLEFNSDAFKLDSTAQVQDLIRILPGVTLWMADGTITVNGKAISTVLVNGKPFFGDDPKIALQNLPKNIVDKIQVYQRVSESVTKKDSINILDIKLKKGKESGHFGKLDVGYGTSGHYESDATLNYFNGRNQLGTAFTSNNVNKVANNMTFVLRNNTFKGNEASTEYRSDFTAPGINNFTSTGLLIQHDFTDSPSYKNQDQLSGVYFFKDNRAQINQQLSTVTTINDSTIFNVSNQTQYHTSTNSQDGDLTYIKSLGDARLTVTNIYNSDNTNGGNSQLSRTTDRTGQFLSSQNSNNSIERQNSSYSISAGLDKFWSPKLTWNSVYQLNYHAIFTNSNTHQSTQTSYIAADSSQNTFIDRRYHPATNATDQSLSFQLPYLSMLVAGQNRPKSVKAGLSAELRTNTCKNNNDVYDMDTATKSLAVNTALSNQQHDLTYDFQPALDITKAWMNSDPQKPPKTFRNFFTNISLSESFHGYKSWSIQNIQNLTRTYRHFTPSLGLNYTQSRGSANKMARISFSIQYAYPTLQQLAPLVDNSNPNYIQLGNINLREEKLENLDFSFSGSIQKKNGGAFSWTTNIRGAYSDNYFAANTLIDSLGQTRSFTVNARGYRRIYISVELKKAFRTADANKLQIQLTALPEFSIDHSPRYVNNLLSFYNNYNLVITPTLNLTYKDWFTFNLYEREGWARSTQTNQTSLPLTNHTSSTTATGWIKLTRSFSVTSNVTYTTNTSTASPRQAFTLWNASAGYRLFKDQTGEIKFSALDILHQNTGLINRAADNTITHGDANVLQQYFMLTFAWHPRKFGKK